MPAGNGINAERFSVRVWPEDIGDGQIEWRGKIQHIASGEARYFRDWATLTTFLQTMLSELRPDDSPLSPHVC